ncbi:hypothetical protein L218DRAFT_1008382 [Marasmius fiardii PR-910]|nr:hypothetical protein L218DRAFT_1008382 [Marasmius fiardii PR-910]
MFRYRGKAVNNNGLFWEALAQAQKLEEVRMWELCPLCFLPFHQLTALVIESLRPDNFKNLLILEVSIKLRTLKLKLFTSALDDIIDIPRRIKVPSLHTLSIRPGYDGEGQK